MIIALDSFLYYCEKLCNRKSTTELTIFICHSLCHGEMHAIVISLMGARGSSTCISQMGAHELFPLHLYNFTTIMVL